MTEHDDIPEEDDALAAEYALGLLAGAELAEVESRLEREGALRTRVAFWQEEFVSLADDLPEADPPRIVWRRIAAELPPARPAPRPPRVGLWRAWAVLTTAAAAVLAALLLLDMETFRRTEPANPPVYAGEIRAGDGSLRLVAAYDEETAVLRLARAEGDAAPGRALQLWAIPEGSDPVSLGVLPEDRRAVLEVPEQLRDGFGTVTLAVSDEPPGGSPTGQPTGDVLAVGGITEL